MDCLRNWLSGLLCQSQHLYKSFARLVWSQAQHNPDHYLAASLLAISRIMPSMRCSAAACEHFGDSCFRDQSGRSYYLCHGIFIMIYLLCMLAGCKLLQDVIDYWRWLAGCYAFCYWQCRLEKSLCADHAGGVMAVAAKRKTPENGITT